MSTKSVKIAYLCWLFGGLFGLHHAYLRRNKHALIWFGTLGGFLIGFIYDAFQIKSYVREANQDEDYLNQLNKLKSQTKIPSFFCKRFFGSIITGIVFNNLIFFCFFKTESLVYVTIVRFASAFIVALMVYLVGTEKPMKCKFKWPLIGSLIGLIFKIHLLSCPIIATFFLNWNIEWDNDKPKETKLKKRVAVFIVYSGFLITLFFLLILNNLTININGEQVNLKDGIYEFINSKEMEKTMELLNTLWQFYKVHGFRKLLNDHFYGYDPAALSEAYNVNLLFIKFLSISYLKNKKNIDN